MGSGVRGSLQRPGAPRLLWVLVFPKSRPLEFSFLLRASLSHANHSSAAPTSRSWPSVTLREPERRRAGWDAPPSGRLCLCRDPSALSDEYSGHGWGQEGGLKGDSAQQRVPGSRSEKLPPSANNTTRWERDSLLQKSQNKRNAQILPKSQNHRNARIKMHSYLGVQPLLPIS